VGEGKRAATTLAELEERIKKTKLSPEARERRRPSQEVALDEPMSGRRRNVVRNDLDLDAVSALGQEIQDIK
jgi:hypothetical protein